MGVTTKHQELAALLDAAGFFSDLDPVEAASLRDEVETNGYSGVFGHDGRFALVDAEELAEGGVGDWLEREIAPLLDRCGASLPEVEGRYPEDGSGHYVIFDGAEHWIWRADELKKETDSWGYAQVRAFELVNNHLGRSSRSERLYAVGGGNDGTALLLTPSQALVLQQHSDIPIRERPYFPVLEADWFGQPY